MLVLHYVAYYIKLSWSDSIRYLGIYPRSSRTLACSFSHATQSIYRAFNAVFGKVGRVASPDVVVELVKTKCLPILCYGVEVCPVNNSLCKVVANVCSLR